MKTIIGAKAIQKYCRQNKFKPHDFMAVVDVWTQIANNADGLALGTYTELDLINHVCSRFPDSKDIRLMAKMFFKLARKHAGQTDIFHLFSPAVMLTVTADGVVAFPNTLKEFKPDWVIKLDDAFRMKLQMAPSGAVSMDTMMDIVYRSRTYKSPVVQGSDIGCDCEVHRLGAELLNEINPMLDKLVDSLEGKTSMMYVFEEQSISIKAVE